MKLNEIIKITRNLLMMSQDELAECLGVPYELINRWENEISVPEERNINLLYSYAFVRHIYINRIIEQMMKDEFNVGDCLVLFHGAKKKISGNIDLTHSSKFNDFGQAFYLGETFEQASTYIAYSSSHLVYPFVLDQSGLKIIKFDVTEEWMLAIAYYRGWIDKYAKNPIIKKIISKIVDADVVIAPIADNQMFNIIGEFVSGSITNTQCIRALSATDLGSQYVIRTEKAISKLKPLDMMYLSDKEKDHYEKKRAEQNEIGLNKVKVVKIKYKRTGKYIEELFK